MEKAYKYRIYPNKRQKELFAKTFGCVRFVYNHYLAKRKEIYENEKKSMSCYDCIKDLTKLKSEHDWLKESDKCSLQNALKDLDSAYKKFFKEGAGYPKFKGKKTHKFSYRTSYTNNNIEVKDKKIKLPKVGWVRTKDKMIPKGRILNATVSQSPSGKYYVSVCCTDVEIEQFPKTCNTVGIDLGIKNFAITSDGEIYDNPAFLKQSLDKLVKLQRELSRKTRGGSNWNKARIKVARMQEHIVNQRKDFLHKLSHQFVRYNDLISVEDLDVKSIMEKKNENLSNKQNANVHRSMADVSWHEFVRQLQYKCDWYGKKLIKVDRYYPSSQICSCCGNKYPIVKDLTVRDWVCPKCGARLDRDINAAINILNEGLRILFAA
jgi:putative transposase